jgi:hypothetical protein
MFTIAYVQQMYYNILMFVATCHGQSNYNGVLMVDSKCATHPSLTRLVTDIVADVTNGDPVSDNYLDRRLGLISELGVGTLANVDDQLHEALESLEMTDEDLHRRLTGWAHVLKSHLVASESATHPALNRLVKDIVADFTNGDRPSNDYVDRRLGLISEMGVGTLANVDDQLHEALKSLEMTDKDLHRRLTGWAHVLKSHSTPSK